MKKILFTLALTTAISGCSTLSPVIDQEELDAATQQKYHDLYASFDTSKIVVDEGIAVGLNLHRNLDVLVKRMEEIIEASRGPEIFLQHAPSLIYTKDKRERDRLAISTSERLNPDGTVEEIEGVDTKPSYSSDLETETEDLTLKIDLLNFWQYYYDRNIHKANVQIRKLNRIKAAQNVTVDTIENFKYAQIEQTLRPRFEKLAQMIDTVKQDSCSMIGKSSSVRDQLLKSCKAIVSTARDLPTISKRLKEARINFNALVTAHPTSEIRLAPVNMSSMPKIHKSLEELIGMALNNSTELEIERLKYIIAKNEQHKAWSDIFPSFEIGISDKSTDNRFQVNREWEEKFSTVILNFIPKMVTAPFRARTAKYKALAANDVRSQAAIVTLATKVALSVDSYNFSIDKWENSNQLALISRDEFYKADAMSKAGENTSFDRINAEANMLFRELQSMIDYAGMFGSAARLYGSLGMTIIPTDQHYRDYSIQELAKLFNGRLSELGIKG